MMMSPECFRNIQKQYDYQKLIIKRDRLLAELRTFEQGKIPKEAYQVFPTPPMIYKQKLEYLGQICMLIAEKYKEER